MNNPIKILLADDHQMFIDGIKALLRKEKHLHFVGEKNNGNDALAFLRSNSIDLLITDISMPGLSGMDLTKIVKREFPDVKVLAVTMYNDPEIIRAILHSEAEGYILKNTGKEELLTAIHKIIDGATHYSTEVLALLMRETIKEKTVAENTKMLTERELEILRLIVQDFSTAQIAEKLFISPRTVDTHRKHILEKTNSRTIVGLIKFAFQQQLA